MYSVFYSRIRCIRGNHVRPSRQIPSALAVIFGDPGLRALDFVVSGIGANLQLGISVNLTTERRLQRSLPPSKDPTGISTPDSCKLLGAGELLCPGFWAKFSLSIVTIKIAYRSKKNEFIISV